MDRCDACLSHHDASEPCPAAYGFGTAFAEMPTIFSVPAPRIEPAASKPKDPA